jgi:hypothetical protein
MIAMEVSTSTDGTMAGEQSKLKLIKQRARTVQLLTSASERKPWADSSKVKSKTGGWKELTQAFPMHVPGGIRLH